MSGSHSSILAPAGCLVCLCGVSACKCACLHSQSSAGAQARAQFLHQAFQLGQTHDAGLKFEVRSPATAHCFTELA